MSNEFPSPIQEAENSIVTERSLKQYEQMLDFNENDLNKWNSIVDLGCGTEQNLAKEIRAINPNISVISIDPGLGLPEASDLSRFMDEEKMTRIRSRENPEPMSIAALAQELPIQTSSVDAVLALHSVPQYISHEKGVEQSINEIIRILNNGGEARIYPVSKINNYQWVAGVIGGNKDKIEFTFLPDPEREDALLLKIVKIV